MMTSTLATPASTVATLPPISSNTQLLTNPSLARRARVALAQGGWYTLWQLRRQAQMLPLLIVVQSLIALGSVIGFGLLYGDVPSDVARYLVTGAATSTLILVGLVMTPQMVAQAKQEGSNDWLHTLPLPRLIFLAADLTIWTFIALPGVVLAVAVGSWRYHLGLHPSPWVVLALVLISLTAASIGYAFACLMPPQGAMLLTQLLLFVVMFFSPLYFPVAHLPGWLQGVHQVLPITPAADLMRACLDPAHFSMTGGAMVVLVAWCVAAVSAAGITLSRRR